MKIYFLNHDLSNKTGDGRFCLSFTKVAPKAIPDAEIKILNSDDLKTSFSKNSLEFAISMSWVRIEKIYSDIYENHFYH